MYLKRVDGPRQVTLPDGTILTRADLPDPDTRRWVASRKAVVVNAVLHGLITQTEAMERYALSEEEFDIWHPAECTGEQGAASGLAVVALADAACRKAFTKGPNILAHMANDAGQRAALSLQFRGGA